MGVGPNSSACEGRHGVSGRDQPESHLPGQRNQVAAAIRDVTERKQAELALKEARREAEHANLASSRFFATASHDLRQPLQTLNC